MTTPTTLSKSEIIDLLRQWVAQSHGIDPRNYISGHNDINGIAAYRQDVRQITKNLNDAQTLIRACELSDGLTAENLVNGFESAYSGRLELVRKLTPKGEVWALDYCTGQYWPTEYRAVVCAVLVYALRDYYRESGNTADDIRAKLTRVLGRKIVERWC